MSHIGWSWVTIWTILGLFSFWIPQNIPGTKKFLLIFSIILLVETIAGGGLNKEIIISYVITSIVSTSTYLIGANISRIFVMGKWPSPKIIAYFIIVFVMAGSFG